MSIFFALTSATISAWTLTPSSTQESDVTESPSTTSSAWSSTGEPAARPGIRSTSTTSPTATLCCLPPLRTIAYTVTPTNSPTERGERGHRRDEPKQSVTYGGPARAGRGTGRLKHAEKQAYGSGAGEVKPRVRHTGRQSSAPAAGRPS